MAASSSFGHIWRVTVKTVAVLAFSTLLASCQLAKNQMEYDRAAEMDVQDFRDLLAPAKIDNTPDDNIPDFEPVLSTPEELRLPSPLVTVSVNQTVSLRDLMFELANQADVDIEMDPQIQGSVIFTAKDRPFDQVVDRICEMAGLRYTFDNNVLRVELDRPYVKNYSVDYLNATRTGDTSISTEISLGNTAGDTAQSSSGGGSSAGVETSISGSIWEELGENIEQILTSSDTYTSLATLSDPVAQPFNPSPVPMPVSADPNIPAPPPLPGSPQVAPMPAAAAPTINISAPPAQPLVPNAPATYSLSPKTGVVSVFASQRQHKLVNKFLTEFRKRATTQVLIEAKVLQVDLSDEYATGIDWSQFNLGTGKANTSISFDSPVIEPEMIGAFSVALNAADVNLVVRAISRFGTVRALSSPRVIVLNNQPAIVNVAQNRVYFNYDVTSQEATADTGASTTIDSEQRSVPEGVLLTVVPTANSDTGEIQLMVRPTVSKITGFVVDPTVALSLALSGAAADLAAAEIEIPENSIPEVSVQEVDSMLRLQSGQMMVMGGLMKDSNIVETTGVPILGDVPYVGNLFKSKVDRIEKSELVVLIKATIISGGASADDMDRKVYKTTSMDRRPSKL
jgi:general secretion pathway protein D